MATMVMIPGFDNVMRGNDPLGLLGSDFFTEEDLRNNKYQPLIRSACKYLKNCNATEAFELKNTILRLHREYQEAKLLLGDNSALTVDEVTEITRDKKYATLWAIVLSLSLSVNFNVSLNFDIELDLNELWDQIVTLIEEHNNDGIND